MTLNDLENDCLDRLNYDPQPADGAARVRVRRYLNQWHRRILTTPGLDQLREDVTSFTSIQGQARYALPPSVSRIKRIYEPTTNRIRLVERSLDWYRNLPTTISGVPECYIPFGRGTTQFMVGGNVSSTVMTVGPTASSLWAVSSSASDTNVVLYTECFRTGGYFQRDMTTLTGTSRVQISSVTDFLECDKAYLDRQAVGNVSIYDAQTNGNELLRIIVGDLQVSYLTVVLWPAPSAAWTFYVDYQRDIRDMQQPTDMPLTPPDFDDVLLMGARYDDYGYKKDFMSQRQLQAEIIKRTSDIMNWVTNNDDLIIVPGQQPRGTRFSNLGSWFPSGTW